jgi:hypothetical protein
MTTANKSSKAGTPRLDMGLVVVVFLASWMRGVLGHYWVADGWGSPPSW